MVLELMFTSAAHGLKPGSRGYCTVALTSGMAANLVQRLETLSGYRPALPSSAPIPQHPVNYAFTPFSLGGQKYFVLSRVCFSGLDYTQRNNKFAHHIALTRNELPPDGPAWLALQPGFFTENWSGKPRLLPPDRIAIPQIPRPCAPAHAWTQFGDPGWAGYLAHFAMKKAQAACVLIVPLERYSAVLRLLDETIALLPAHNRWRAGFSTYLADSPSGACPWRCVPPGSPLISQFRRNRKNLILDLSETLANLPESELDETGMRLVACARNGQDPWPAKPTAAAASRPAAAHVASMRRAAANRGVSTADPRATPPEMPSAQNPVSRVPPPLAAPPSFPAAAEAAGPPIHRHPPISAPKVRGRRNPALSLLLVFLILGLTGFFVHFILTKNFGEDQAAKASQDDSAATRKNPPSETKNNPSGPSRKSKSAKPKPYRGKNKPNQEKTNPATLSSTREPGDNTPSQSTVAPSVHQQRNTITQPKGGDPLLAGVNIKDSPNPSNSASPTPPDPNRAQESASMTVTIFLEEDGTGEATNQPLGVKSVMLPRNNNAGNQFSIDRQKIDKGWLTEFTITIKKKRSSYSVTVEIQKQGLHCEPTAQEGTGREIRNRAKPFIDSLITFSKNHPKAFRLEDRKGQVAYLVFRKSEAAPNKKDPVDPKAPKQHPEVYTLAIDLADLKQSRALKLPFKIDGIETYKNSDGLKISKKAQEGNTISFRFTKDVNFFSLQYSETMKKISLLPGGANAENVMNFLIRASNNNNIVLTLMWKNEKKGYLRFIEYTIQMQIEDKKAELTHLQEERKKIAVGREKAKRKREAARRAYDSAKNKYKELGQVENRMRLAISKALQNPEGNLDKKKDDLAKKKRDNRNNPESLKKINNALKLIAKFVRITEKKEIQKAKEKMDLAKEQKNAAKRKHGEILNKLTLKNEEIETCRREITSLNKKMARTLKKKGLISDSKEK